MMEPWDGPAAMVFTDGRQIGATLDRNGLRPARYIVTDDDLVVMASESGVLPIPRTASSRSGACSRQDVPDRPSSRGRIVDDGELKNQFASPALPPVDREPCASGSTRSPPPRPPAFGESLLDRQQAFGYTQEDIKFLLAPMAPPARKASARWATTRRWRCCRTRTSRCYNYFKQLFAQVTNPPIDPIREGHRDEPEQLHRPKPNLLDINAVNPPMRLEVRQPDPRLRRHGAPAHIENTPAASSSYELDITYPLAWGAPRRRSQAGVAVRRAVDAISSGHNILIITDRRMDREDASRSGAAGAVGHPPPPGARGPAHHGRPGGRDRLGARGAPLRGAGRLRRRGRAPVPGDGDAGRAARQDLPGALSRREGHLQLRQGHRQGSVEDHVEDGRVHLHVLLRRARCSRPSAWRRASSTKYFPAPRRRWVASACSRWPKKPCACTATPSATTRCWPHARRRRRIRLAHPRRGHMWTPDAIAKLQHSTRSATLRHLRNTPDHQRPEQAPHDAARPVRVQRSIPAGPSARRGRAGRPRSSSASPPARCRSARSAPGARDAGHGDEPHRRQEQHRRRRRGGRALPHELKASPPAPRSRVVGAKVIEADYAMKEGDSLRSKIKQVASGRFGVTAEYLVSTPTRSRSRWPRAPNPARAASCPAARSAIHRLPALLGAGRRPDRRRRTTTSIHRGPGAADPRPEETPTRAPAYRVKLVSKWGVGTIAAGVAKARPTTW